MVVVVVVVVVEVKKEVMVRGIMVVKEVVVDRR